MTYVVPHDRLSEHVQVFFVFKLRRVAANEGDFWQIAVQLLEPVHLGEHVDTIDAAARPEVDDDELSFELIVEGPSLVVPRVQPRNTVRHLRCRKL